MEHERRAVSTKAANAAQSRDEKARPQQPTLLRVLCLPLPLQLSGSSGCATNAALLAAATAALPARLGFGSAPCESAVAVICPSLFLWSAAGCKRREWKRRSAWSCAPAIRRRFVLMLPLHTQARFSVGCVVSSSSLLLSCHFAQGACSTHAR